MCCRVDGCCFCLDLRMGCMVIGIIGTVWNFFGFVGNIAGGNILGSILQLIFMVFW